MMKKILLTIMILSLGTVWLPAHAAKIKVKRGQSWYSLFPSEHDRSIVMRINHRNGELWPGLVLEVPDDLNTSTLLDYAPLPHQAEAQGEKIVVVDLSQHAWAAYDADGMMVRWGPATGGRTHCPDDEEKSCRTKEGEFRIYSLGTSNCVSSKFPEPEGGAPMPYCMFFNGGQALHGSPGGVIKGNASHGCVRMFVQDAEWLRYSFVEPPMAANNYRGTKVVVLSSLQDKEKAKDTEETKKTETETENKPNKNALFPVENNANTLMTDPEPETKDGIY